MALKKIDQKLADTPRSSSGCSSAPGAALAIEVVFAALCVAVSLRLREAPHLVSTRQKLALYGAFVGGILMFAPTASLTARELAARFGVEF